MPDHAMNYLECDIPAGITIAQWRRDRRVPARPALLPRLRARLGLR